MHSNGQKCSLKFQKHREMALKSIFFTFQFMWKNRQVYSFETTWKNFNKIFFVFWVTYRRSPICPTLEQDDSYMTSYKGKRKWEGGKENLIKRDGRKGNRLA